MTREGIAPRAGGYGTAVRAMALSFDDGPDPVWTPRLLDVLARAGARATFFPIASRARAHPRLIGRMRAEGHVIGLHGDEHVRHSTRDAQWGRRDLRRALHHLAQVGVRPALWRTPWGDVAPWSPALARTHGLRFVWWTVDTRDWRGGPAEAMFARVAPSLADGAVVLAHDGTGPGARRAHARETVALVERIVEHAGDHGVDLVALGDDARPRRPSPTEPLAA